MRASRIESKSAADLEARAVVVLKVLRDLVDRGGDGEDYEEARDKPGCGL
jgi:hypothetical protein